MTMPFKLFLPGYLSSLSSSSYAGRCTCSVEMLSLVTGSFTVKIAWRSI